MRPLQYFSKGYLDRCVSMKPEQIVQFLEDFRNLHSGAKTQRTKLISIKVPRNLLETFKAKAKLHGTPYQTQIKRLMLEWMR